MFIKIVVWHRESFYSLHEIKDKRFDLKKRIHRFCCRWFLSQVALLPSLGQGGLFAKSRVYLFKRYKLEGFWIYSDQQRLVENSLFLIYDTFSTTTAIFFNLDLNNIVDDSFLEPNVLVHVAHFSVWLFHKLLNSLYIKHLNY